MIISRVIAIITCFTVGHSLTLALATVDLFHIPPAITEPLIALTICSVGVENYLRKGESSKYRWLVALLFGLIHGFGFATVLRDLGVGANGSGIVVPLFGFNLGVEIGQLIFAAIILPIWRLQPKPGFRDKAVPVMSVIIAAAGLCWFIQRVLV